MRAYLLYSMIFGLSLFCNLLSYGQESDVNQQTSPTLQIGLSGLSLKKGTLDAELIQEIIAEKQEEVKIRLVQDMLLKKLNSAGGTFYVFADNIIKTALKEKDNKLRISKILESTVNLAFVTSFATYYIKTIENDKDSNEYKNLRGLITSLENSITSFDDLNRVSSLQDFKPQRKKVIADSPVRDKFWSIMIDLVSEVIRTNEALHSKGLMRLSYDGSYYSLNEYLNLKSCSSTDTFFERSPVGSNGRYRDTENSFQIDEAIDTINKATQDNVQEVFLKYRNARLCLQKNYADRVYSDIKRHLEFLIDYSGIIKSFVNEAEFITRIKPTEGLSSTFSTEIAKGHKLLLQAMVEIRVNTSITEDKRTEVLNKLSRINTLYLQIINSEDETLKPAYLINNSDAIRRIKDEVIPILIEYQIYHGNLFTLRNQVELIYRKEAILLFHSLAKGIGIKEFKFELFFKLLSNIYEFNKVETYSDFINALTDIGKIFPNDKIRSTINTMVSFVKDYSTVITDKEGEKYLSFNVESFLTRLSNVKFNRWRPLSMHFTVGTNSAYFYKLPVPVGDEQIRNYAFVGEKIGVKWKLIDRQFKKSHNKGETFRYYGNHKRNVPPTEPVLSNIHFLIYGSGLVYNIVNTGTTSDFNNPMLATGIGLTFWNDLDLNFSIGVPIRDDQTFKSNFDHPFFNIGFDIQFFEYLSKLNKKRRQNKTNKQLQGLHEKNLEYGFYSQ